MRGFFEIWFVDQGWFADAAAPLIYRMQCTAQPLSSTYPETNLKWKFNICACAYTHRQYLIARSCFSFIQQMNVIGTVGFPLLTPFWTAEGGKEVRSPTKAYSKSCNLFFLTDVRSALVVKGVTWDTSSVNVANAQLLKHVEILANGWSETRVCFV